jgi:poly(A) polymerase
MPVKRPTEGEDMLRTVTAVLRARGVEGWLVGGTVRDRNLGRYSPDVDVAVAGEAAAVAVDVARKLHAPWFALSERHGAFRVVVGHAHIDVATVRGKGILADLALRDFTVNAMAVPLEGGGIIDPFRGLDDLRSGRLAAVSDHIFDDDPLRLLRAPRFAHVLGLRLDPPLTDAVRVQAPRLWRAAPERIATEMVLTLAAGAAGDAARLWNDLGLLGVLIPELVEEGRLSPSLGLLDRLEQILVDLPGRFPDSASLLESRLAEPVDGAIDRRVALRLAGLVRGIGPEQALRAGRRLKVSSALLSLLQTTARISGHADLLPGVDGPPPATANSAGLDPSAHPVDPGRDAVLFLWAAGPWEPEIILLSAAAAPAGTSAGAAASLMTLWAGRATSGAPRLPFDGVGLMKELDLSPGPRLGRALRAARLAWEAGEATTAEQALAAAKMALDEG